MGGAGMALRNQKIAAKELTKGKKEAVDNKRTRKGKQSKKDILVKAAVMEILDDPITRAIILTTFSGLATSIGNFIFHKILYNNTPGALFVFISGSNSLKKLGNALAFSVVGLETFLLLELDLSFGNHIEEKMCDVPLISQYWI